MQRYLLSEIKYLRILGRNAGRCDPLALFWTGAGIELNVTGTELAVELSAGYESYEPWIEVIVDGALYQRRMLDRGVQKLCLYRTMEPDKARRVRLLKATQAPGSDPASFLEISAVWTDGEFLPLPAPARRIEVIGDSITSGEGLHGALNENSWNAGAFGFYGSYSMLLGEALDADVHVISQSGYGIFCNWCGDPRESLPQYYEQICGVLRGTENAARGVLNKWDFAAWQPDAIVVNLGTNDSGSFDQAGEWFPERSWRCPMRRNSDGSMYEEDRQRIAHAVIEFLYMLRKDNPDSYILWAYGMIPGRLAATLRTAVQTYAAQTGDLRAEFMLLPETRPGEYGARMHPGLPAHKNAAAVLAEKLRTIWSPDAARSDGIHL